MKGTVLLTVIGTAVFMGYGVASPLASLYAESLQASYFMIGLLSTTRSLTGFLAGYLWGRQSDKTARRRVFLVGGLAGACISASLTAVIPNYLYLFPLRILQALSQAAYSTVGLALMGDLLELRKGRGRTMGIYRGVQSLGFALMAFVSGSIADRTSLRAPFFWEAGFMGLAFCLSFLVRDVPLHGREAPRQPEETGASPKAAGDEGRHPSMTPLLVSGLVFSLALSAVLSVWANYMVKEQGYTRTALTRLWSLEALVEFPLMIAAGSFSDQVGRLPILASGLVGWVVVFLGYATIPVYPWILVIQLIRGFAYSAYEATAMAYVAEASSRANRGRTSGLYSAVRGLGSIVGGTLGGSLAQTLGFVPMMLICAGLLFAGAVYLMAAHIVQGRAAMDRRMHLGG
jgi:MFS family permease